MSPGAGADVVVVGAGPTGLLLAGDLAEAGADVLVLEKRFGRSNLTRAFAVHARRPVPASRTGRRSAGRRSVPAVRFPSTGTWTPPGN